MKIVEKLNKKECLYLKGHSIPNGQKVFIQKHLGM